MNTTLQRAKKIFYEEKHTCVFLSENKMITDDRSGIIPVFERAKSGEDFSHFVVADKIVGSAAAFLYIKMNIAAVYASVISKRAVELLKENAIFVEYDTLTDNIINRRGDDLCPMEKCVENCFTSSQAFEKLEEKILEMTKN